VLQCRELLLQQVQLQLSRDGVTAQHGNFCFAFRNGLLLIDDGFLKQPCNGLKGFDIANLVQLRHEE